MQTICMKKAGLLKFMLRSDRILFESAAERIFCILQVTAVF